MYQHHVDTDLDGNAVLPNNFYGVQNYSDVTLLFNDRPGSVKSFNTINYEGTQSRITQFATVTQGGVNYTDKEYYNLNTKTGWFVDSITTDLQEVDDVEFKNKEGKWFGTVKGVSTTLANLDEEEFSVQGLGAANSETTGNPVTFGKIKVYPNTQSSTGTNWDSSADSTDWIVVNAPEISGQHGQAISAGSAESTLTPMILNSSNVYVYSGLPLNAKDFTVPGGTLTSTGSGSTIKYIFTAAGGWNADTGVTKVEFSNNGLAGDPGNTVKCEVFYSGFTMPASGDKKLYVDVDHNSTIVHGGNVYRPSCVKVHYNTTRNANGQSYTITQTNVSGISETDITNFDPNGHNFEKSFKHHGDVLEGQSHLVAEYVVETGAGAYLVPRSNGEGGQLVWHNHLASQPWTNYYTTTHTSVYHTSSGNTSKIKKVTCSVYYSPPVGVNGLDPDPIQPEGGFCEFLHCFELDWMARAIQPKTSSQNLAQTLHHQFNNTSSQYNNIDLVTTSAGQISVTVKDDTNKYYNFNYTQEGFGTGTWGNADQVYNNTIDVAEAGTLSMPITLPSASSTTKKTFEYYATQTSGGEGVTHLTLMSSMPTTSAKKSFTQQSAISNNIILTDKANTTKTPTQNLSGITALPNTEFKSTSDPKSVRVSFAYTAGAGKKITLDRQPNEDDLSFGSKTVAIFRAESAGTTTVRVLTSLLTGINTGSTIQLETPYDRFTARSGTADKTDTATGFSTADIAKMAVGMKCTWAAVEGDTPQVMTIQGISGTTVTFTTGFYADVANNTGFSFDGPMPRGTTITNIASGGEGQSYSNLTISQAMTKDVSTPAEFRISSGWSVAANLTAKMLETTSVSGSPAVVTKRQNEKVHIVGTVNFGSCGSAVQNVTINPNFFTVSNL